MAATALPAASLSAPSNGAYETVTVWPPSTASTSASVTVFPATATDVAGQDRLSTRAENASGGGGLPVSVSSNVSVSVEPETAAALSAGGLVSTVQFALRWSDFSFIRWRFTNAARCLLPLCVLKYALRSRAIRLRYAASAL